MVLQTLFHVEMLLVAILIIGVASDSNERWSRQLSDHGNNDWVPLSTSTLSKRQASSRVLGQPAPFQSSFFPADTFSSDYIPQDGPRQLFLQSVPAGPQSFNSDPLQLTLTNRYNPLAQGFVPPPPPPPPPSLQYSRNVPFHQPLSTQYVQNPSQFNNQLYNQAPKSEVLAEKPKSINNSNILSVSDKSNKINPTASTQKVTERSSGLSFGPTTPPGTTIEKEEVQLLYVPLETLQNDKFDMKEFLKKSQKESIFRDSLGSSGQINNQLYAPTTPNYVQRQQSQLHNIQQDLLQQAFNAQSLQGSLRQNPFDRQPKYQQTSFPFSQSYPIPVVTTPKSKKLKAHQPPLAVFMIQKGQEKAQLTDVLSILKDSRSVAVLDTISPNNPKVFIGPSTLRTPDNYAKFELPYLSNVDGNRIQKKIENLPFFVAPLSYKAPQGFAKIPFPAPHVGSVIVNPYMQEQDFGKTSTFVDSRPSTISYSTFGQNPSTESVKNSFGGGQSNLNFFNSATSNPLSSQNNGLNYQNGFSQLDQNSIGSFGQSSNNRKPEPISNTLRPTSNYFSSTPTKSTVSYFSFASPEYSTLPTTTHKPTSTLGIHDNRGHYITNAAGDTSATPLRTTQTVKENTRPQTTPVSPTTKYQPQNAYNINQGFILKNPYEPPGFQFGSIRQNEIRDNFPPIQQQVQYVNQQGFNSFSQAPQRPVTTSERPVQDVRYSTISQYSPRPYLNENLQTITDVSAPEQQQDIEINKQNENSFVDISSQFTSPAVEDINYEPEREIINPTVYDVTTTTTTTTTTPAPTTTTTTEPPATRPTRRPIQRGRPRYTTPKSDDDESPRATTRRTPLRERRPITYRSRTESSRTTTTEATQIEEVNNNNNENNNFESAKNTRVETSERAKLPTRQPFRSRYQDEDSKPTTESSASQTVSSNRNQRIRTRGRTQYKATNLDGTEAVGKNKKKEGGVPDSIAYQRDVLHQNYPVTLSERLTTLEVHTTTSYPSTQNLDLGKGKIRIYETTGSRNSIKENIDADTIYENQPIFEAEQEKYLTNPDAYVEISNPNIGNNFGQNNYVSEQDPEKVSISSTAKYESEISHEPQTVTQEYYSKSTPSSNYDEEEIETERIVNIDRKAYYTSTTTPAPTEKVTEPATTTTTTSAPASKFRNKLRQRPKLLSSLSTKQLIEDSKPKASEQTTRSYDENSENTYSTTRRTLVHPVTYRPAFDRRRTTMRIEEIEEDLKANRVQLRSRNQSTTRKYPVYVPDSTTSRPTTEAAEVEITTRRNNFARRRVTRPTSVPVTTQSSTGEDQQNKRVKIRGRLRTRPTTTERADVNEESTNQTSDISEDGESEPVTQRTLVQKFSSRNRVVPKYTRKPLFNRGKIQQSNSENDDDQAPFDSINRPEYIEYDPENGKSESQWSSKAGYDSFKPIFNPNSISEESKTEFSPKYSSQESNTEDSDIITARNSYDDVLISVTPASNNYKIEESQSTTVEDDSTTTTERVKDETELPDAVSTFESVLEEVMKNLEEQDENEYNNEFGKSVMKHKGGEIGEIPPENDAITETTGLGFLEQAFFGMGTDVKKVNAPITTTEKDVAQDRMFSTAPDAQITTTERQPRRRGVWRRIKVRPLQKDALETAESQFYKSSGNDVSVKEKIDFRKKIRKSEKNSYESDSVTENQYPAIELQKQTEPIISTEVSSTDSPGDMDLGTGSPDAVIMDVEKVKNDTETTDPPTTVNYEIIEENNSKTTFETATEVDTEKYEKETETSDSYSTDIPLGIAMEPEEESSTINDEDTNEQTTMREVSNFENTLGKLLSVMELPQEVVPVESTDETINDDNTEKPEGQDPVTTTPVNLLDPKNIISTSVSTEVSHETEICFRGRCVKSKKDDLS